MLCNPRNAALTCALVVPCSLLSAQESAAIYDAPLVVTDDQHRIARTLDFTGDGIDDAVGWWWQSDSYSWATVTGWRTSANGRLVEEWQFGVNPDAGSFNMESHTQAGALDTDGLEDFAITFAHEIFPFVSNGTNDPVEWPPLSMPGNNSILGFRILDMNADGFGDFVIGTGNRIYTYLSSGDGSSWTQVTSLGIGTPAGRIELGDIDGDGLEDVILSSGHSVRLYTAIGGVLNEVASYVDQIGGTPLALYGEVTGDGLNDIVLFSETASVQQLLRRTGAATFDLEPIQVGGPATGLADVNGDGLLDGVCCGGGTYSDVYNDVISHFQIALNDGAGNFGDSYDFRIRGLGAMELAGVEDLDQDGDADLIAGRVVYYARGPLVEPPFESLGAQRQEPRQAFDVDMDGDLDLELGFETGLANLGNGTFVEQPSLAEAPAFLWRYNGPGFPGDWDGDGDCDLVVEYKNNGAFQYMTLLANDGTGYFLHPGAAGDPFVNFNFPGAEPNVASDSLAEDVDGDGDLDLIVNYAQGSDSPLNYDLQSQFWLNDGTGFFTQGPYFDTEIVKAVGDFNLDGLPDLVTMDNGNYRVRVRLAVGPRDFGPANMLTIALVHYPHLGVEVVDFDKNGNPDLAMSSASDWAAVFYGDGTGAFQLYSVENDLESFSSTERVMVVSDYDGDGWQDYLSGPVDYSPGTLSIRRKNPGGTGWSSSRTLQVLSASVVADVDGDGDEDLIAEGVYFNQRLDPATGNEYCTPAPNSTGFAAMIEAQGSTSVAENNLTLYATSLPANVPGLFFYGAGQIEVPFGEGFRCVGGGGIFRLHASSATAGGVLMDDVDFTAPPSVAGEILAGTTWNFQGWYRDTTGGPAGFNLSTAVELSFVP